MTALLAPYQFARSLALQTELGLWATRGQIIPRTGYTVVRTPSDPGYYFGNLLLLPQPPTADAIALWTARCKQEFADPAYQHATLWWDEGEVAPATRDILNWAGFAMEQTHVLTRDAATPFPLAPLPPDIAVRTITGHEADALAALSQTVFPSNQAGYAAFCQRRANWQAQLIRRDLAVFFGAYHGATLVASLGIFFADASAVRPGTPRWARYQDVQTAPPFRQRGLAAMLLAHAAAHASARGCQQLVIVVAPENPAERLYQRLGFTRVATTQAACHYPRTSHLAPTVNH